MLESMRLEPSPELLLSVPLCNLCPTGVRLRVCLSEQPCWHHLALRACRLDDRRAGGGTARAAEYARMAGVTVNISVVWYTLPYPSAEVSLVTHVGKETHAMQNDGKLQLEIMKWKPQNTNAALSHAIKLEAFEQSLACRGMMVDQDNGSARPRLWTVSAVAEPSDASRTAALCK